MTHSTQGRFIVLEGIDASGKSTQASKLASWLESQGRRVHLTAEPTSGPIGALIRQAFTERVPLDDRVIAALFVADRLDHLTNSHDGLLRMLADGIDVVSDRYYLSSAAYHASDVDIEWVVRANAISTDLLRPDLTIYLDLDPEEALARIERRRGIPDKFEARGRLESAHANYARAIARLAEVDFVRCIPANRDADSVFEDILNEYKKATL
jgi:dTMP kinase